MKRFIPVLALLFGLQVFSQVKQEVFESFKLQEKRDVQYYIPEEYDEEKKHALIVVLDAEYLFEDVVAKAKFYHKFHGMPPAIVVGIDQGKNQLRKADCAFDETNGLPSDKGKMFFEFLGMELIPYMETTYNIAPFKMIVGYDITANFGNFYLFKEQPMFNSYVSISPVLALEMESRVATRINALDKQIFYHLIAEKDPKEKDKNINALNSSLKGIDKESFHYYYDEYPADHISIVTYGMGKAFDDVFSIFKPISPTEYKEKIITSDEPVFDYLKNKYAMIEDLYGFSKEADLNDIMAIYAGCRKKEDIESLKALSDLCKKTFPETMMGFYFEGEALEWEGEPKKALRTFEKAFGMEEIDFLTKDMALDKMDALKADFGF